MSQGAVGPIQSIPVAAVTGSNQTLVAAVAGKRIRVLALYLTASATGTVTLHDGTPTAMSGAIAVGTALPLNLQKADCGWGDTAVDEALEVDVATATVNGILTYQLIN